MQSDPSVFTCITQVFPCVSPGFPEVNEVLLHLVAPVEGAAAGRASKFFLLTKSQDGVI